MTTKSYDTSALSSVVAKNTAILKARKVEFLAFEQFADARNQKFGVSIETKETIESNRMAYSLYLSRLRKAESSLYDASNASLESLEIVAQPLPWRLVIAMLVGIAIGLAIGVFNWGLH